MPKGSIEDIKPRDLTLEDIKPRSSVIEDIKPRNLDMSGEINRGYSVVLSAGMYMGLPWLIRSTAGTVTQWSEISGVTP